MEIQASLRFHRQHSKIDSASMFNWACTSEKKYLVQVLLSVADQVPIKAPTERATNVAETCKGHPALEQGPSCSDSPPAARVV